MLTALQVVCQAFREARSGKTPLAAKTKGKAEKALAKLEKLALPTLLLASAGGVPAPSSQLPKVALCPGGRLCFTCWF